MVNDVAFWPRAELRDRRRDVGYLGKTRHSSRWVRRRLVTDAVEKVSFLLIASDWRGIEIGESLGGGSGLIVPWISGNRRARERDGWTKGSKRQGLQVLYDGREKKFVAGAEEPAEPHAFETMVGLEVSKAKYFLRYACDGLIRCGTRKPLQL